MKNKTNSKTQVCSFEEEKKRIDKIVEQSIDAMREADYREVGVRGAREAFDGKFSAQEEIMRDIEEIYNGIEEGENTYDEFVKEKRPALNKLKLTEEKFLFPCGDEANVRRVQLQALKYANTCYDVRGTVSDSIVAFDKEMKNMENDVAFKSAVVIKGQVSFEVVNKALLNAISNTEKHDRITGKYDNIEVRAKQLYETRRIDCDYELAREIKQGLKDEGIESVIVNRTTEATLITQKTVRSKNVLEIVDDSLSLELRQMDKKETPVNKPHKLIWWSAAGIMAVFWIIMMSISMRGGDGFVFTILGNIVPIVYVIAWYVAIEVKNSHIKMRNEQRAKLKSQVMQYIKDTKKPQVIEELDRQIDIIEICRIVDEEIISVYYDKMCKAINRSEEVCARMMEFLNKLNNDISAITYLPHGINTDHIPKIIELMESGAASDYKSAAYQTIQNEITNAFNELQIEFMKAAETRRANEARAQKEMHEYYERQRIAQAGEIASHQAELARRTEQYAKEQAEAAKRAADAQAEAAKQAKKQAEAAEELLRRSDDPYYINRWKKDN